VEACGNEFIAGQGELSIWIQTLQEQHTWKQHSNFRIYSEAKQTEVHKTQYVQVIS
jgi:hypothetical protein